MTEAEWLGAAEPTALLASLLEPLNHRKLRLFVTGCHRLLWHLLSELEQQVPAAAEQYLEGKITLAQFDAAYAGNDLFGDERAPLPEEYPLERALAEVEYITEYAGFDEEVWAAQAALVREIFGNPFRPVAVDPSWRAWREGLILQLAQSIYDSRALPTGTLANDRLAVLADALEEAGCTSADLLSHLRSPGPHYLGCWTIDLLLGRE